MESRMMGNYQVRFGKRLLTGRLIVDFHFDDARSKFDVRFYLVALLFLVMDLEILFCFPFSISLADIGAYGYNVTICFLVILTVGFFYEWSKGALDWSQKSFRFTVVLVSQSQPLVNHCLINQILNTDECIITTVVFKSRVTKKFFIISQVH